MSTLSKILHYIIMVVINAKNRDTQLLCPLNTKLTLHKNVVTKSHCNKCCDGSLTNLNSALSN